MTAVLPFLSLLRLIVRQSQKIFKLFLQNLLTSGKIECILITVSTRTVRVLIRKKRGEKGMELTERQKKILIATIEHHIATGEPLGSKQLAELLPNAPSSATLRNEMSFLCEAGLLSQPHTSAGRLPTSEGYRLYVNSLMKEDEIDQPTKQMIDDTLNGAAAEADDLTQVASKLLSKITGLPAIASVSPVDNAVVEKIQIIPLGNNVFMMALLTSDGRIETRVCKTQEQPDQRIIELFYSVTGKHIINKPISELTPAAVQNILVFAGLDALEIAPLFNSLSKLLKSAAASRLDVNGESNVFSMLREEEKAKKLLSLLERKEAILSLVNNINSPLGVVFGRETSYSELNPSAVIVARIGTDDKGIGRVAVIGPTRMSYDRIIPSTKYIAAKLSSLLGDNNI